ncbi:hypothetical protein SAY87_001815 [Trapa incisa]|uniref:Uncharacterized protein n=1 Tax=Trapa incisa TaxID=236973 RepID=A0AAN7JSY8_9MYRT|nr:hypothetical protein SAY87_001815 [Trapa incisa]
MSLLTVISFLLCGRDYFRGQISITKGSLSTCYELREVELLLLCSLACILWWTSYKEKPIWPMSQIPFEFLNVHGSFDGSISDHLHEETVLPPLRASCFEPLAVKDYESWVKCDHEDYYSYDYE